MKLHFLVSHTPQAKRIFSHFKNKFKIVDSLASEADVFVVFGGDGFMLKSLREYYQYNKPFYGINCGQLGFLLNSADSDVLLENQIEKCVVNHLNPLVFKANTCAGKQVEGFAINEVAIIRQKSLSVHIKVLVNKQERIICSGDGVLVATPAGSTAYNASAGGVILPLNTNLINITPICCYKPKNWPGALLHDNVVVELEVQNTGKRPANLMYDNQMIDSISRVTIQTNKSLFFKLLFLPNNSLEERIIKEQFV